MDKIIELADMDRKTAENEALRMCTDLFNRVDEKSIDMTKLELALRNMFGTACQWMGDVAKKESKSRKSYIDGLEDMFDASADNHEERYDHFFSNIWDAKENLIEEFNKHK